MDLLDGVLEASGEAEEAASTATTTKDVQNLIFRSVYPAESYMAADRTPYHKSCLKCSQCEKRLTPASLNEHDQRLFCQHCYQTIFIAPVSWIRGG